MAVAPGSFLAAALLLLSSGHHCLSPPPPCPDVCTCQRDPVLFNCSSAGLYLVPRHIPASVSELHLSHNHLPSVALDRPLHKLQTLWLDDNSITHLSFCVERTRVGRRGRHMSPWSRQGCDSWAPTLQLLSAENNQLQQLPEGESVLQNHGRDQSRSQNPQINTVRNGQLHCHSFTFETPLCSRASMSIFTPMYTLNH